MSGEVDASLVGPVEAAGLVADELTRRSRMRGNDVAQQATSDRTTPDHGGREHRRRARFLGERAELADDVARSANSQDGGISRWIDHPNLDDSVEEHDRMLITVALTDQILTSCEPHGAAPREQRCAGRTGEPPHQRV